MNLVFWEVHLAESQDLIMWPSKLLSHLTYNPVQMQLTWSYQNKFQLNMINKITISTKQNKSNNITRFDLVWW